MRHLDPRAAAARRVGAVAPLGDDALHALFGRRGQQGLTVGVGRGQRQRGHPGEVEAFEGGAAFEQRPRGEVDAVEAQDVGRHEGDGSGGGAGGADGAVDAFGEGGEAGDAAVDQDDLAVEEQVGRDGVEAGELGEAAGDVASAAGVEPDGAVADVGNGDETDDAAGA